MVEANARVTAALLVAVAVAVARILVAVTGYRGLVLAARFVLFGLALLVNFHPQTRVMFNYGTFYTS